MTAPFFGDFEVDDALDTAPPAPEQIARRLHRYRRYLSKLAGVDIGPFGDQSRRDQDEALAVAERIVAWLKVNDPSDRADLAEAIHNIRASIDPDLPMWDELGDDEADLADALAEALGDWLIREGAWT